MNRYPELRTSDRVTLATRQSPPPGAVHSMWWWDCGKGAGERMDPERRSLSNEGEATGVAALVAHFVRSGVSPKRITVLAAYTEQVMPPKTGRLNSCFSGTHLSVQLPPWRKRSLPGSLNHLANRNPKPSTLAQVRTITARLGKVVEKEFEGGWPKEDPHGVAAKNTLDTLSTPCPVAERPTRVNRCLDVGETFLKLGEVARAKKAYTLAANLVAPSSPAHALIVVEAARIEQMSKLHARVDAFWDGASADVGSASPSDAIEVLKRLEALAAQWLGTDAVAASAAACHLRDRLAKRISEAPSKVSEGQKGLLHGMRKSAGEMLASLRGQDAVIVSSIDQYQVRPCGGVAQRRRGG